LNGERRTRETAAAAEPDAGQAGGSDRPNGDRRKDDRRRADRRSEVKGSASPSWFDALGALADSRLEEGPRPVPVPAGGAGRALERVLRSYAAARAAVGVALVLAQLVVSLTGLRPSLFVLAVVLAYALQAIVLWLLPSRTASAGAAPAHTLSVRQWLATIGVDLLAFGTLQAMESETGFNFAALLVLPVLMAGVLTARRVALATTSAVALLLLVLAWLQVHDAADPALPMARAGLGGIGLFAIALVAGELALRLVREETAARESLELARQQAQLNRLVIQELADGLLVVDPRLRVRAANPAARSLLVAQGLAPPAPFDLDSRTAWEPLARAVTQALAEDRWPEAGRELSLVFEEGYVRTVRVRVRFTRGSSNSADAAAGATETLCVLLLEDVRTALARLRQEKLAAMGRVSAGIAHEIRNPLAAITQANALLLEDTLLPAQQRLARIVGENAERLKRIVDDVTELAPGALPEPHAFDAVGEVTSAVEAWAGTAGIDHGPDSRLRTELPAMALPVWFDPEHLRRVLVNLLDNAGRHASHERGAIFVRLAAQDEQRALLSVFSDGGPIAPEVERHLFEPFFSTRSRGSGLGLYICRELCERYGASIEYHPRPGAERLRNEFLVIIRRVAEPGPPRT